MEKTNRIETFTFKDSTNPLVTSLLIAHCSLNNSSLGGDNPEAKTIIEKVLGITCAALTMYDRNDPEKFEDFKKEIDDFLLRVSHKIGISIEEEQTNDTGKPIADNQLSLFSADDGTKKGIVLN